MPAELLRIDAVLGGFLRTEKNHRDIVCVSLAENRIGVNIDFAQTRAELGEQRRNRPLRFFAQVAATPRVERDVARPRGGQPLVFGARVVAVVSQGLIV